MPKVSIIVPVYNTEDYIGECIESILNQSLTDIELILVNDCSTDRSLDILRKYEQIDSRIHIIDSLSNTGVGEARNKGIERASGQYISFVDSDDFLKIDMFEKLYQKALIDKADLVLCDTGTFSSDGREKSVWYKPIYGKAELKDIFHNTQPTARIVSRELIDRIQFRFLKGMGEGIYFELMIHARHITTVPEKLYIYRSRGGSLSTTPNPQNNWKSMENNRIMGERNPDYKDYFTFKMIEDLLQMVANAVKAEDKNAYQEARHELAKLEYTKNPYLSTFYKSELPLHRYFIKVYVLPTSYSIGRFLTTILTK
ncbi:TPA: glycosyltransferase family 2 protein [Streptococcus suis]|uniref:glycosyltransferase family 2 protein n=1 Tax=Streptococcus suis TaxID=1307 RepID=UPI0028C45F3F|nr:glycosyltransferase family 2 protein [Streptococcus suis]WNO77539.1 glycosyltransferase family 2 protein [Streptococcus suis]HEL1757751.1 glycosyltransferase family 2 protein [Streptococcus suis]HEL1759696.1 glycosyltransferase family 2 protein [Streptococcus suis]HEO8607670.1 glycosyltransferase family 2 protein [Streptococcus suis]HEP1568132.1 glycosyltransferase family 2 protein [Streptococcus suis]